jgi:WD40 repeat protein
VFVSSTFSDLQVEREALHARVFPRLQRLCGSLGATFQAVDLRWGVSRRAAEAGETMRICLGEIDRCRAVTARPNFILLLGDRYGWRPVPDEIPALEYDAIAAHLAAAGDGSGAALLRRAYRRDDNAVPPVYTRVTHGAELDEELGVLLRRVVPHLGFGAAARRRYEASATELEVAHRGLLEEASPEGVFGFFRSIEGLPQTALGFNDVGRDGGADVEAKRRLEHLKSVLRDRVGTGIHEYRCRWSDDGPTRDHLEQLCSDVYDRLADTIRRELAGATVLTPLEREIAAHHAFATERSRVFIGRADAVRIMNNYLSTPARHPLVLHGASGSGKSTLMARLAMTTVREGSGPLTRFIGAVAGSTGVRPLLTGIVAELRARAGHDPAGTPTDYDALAAELGEHVAQATAERPVLLLIDAIDQLTPLHGARSLGWLPVNLPDHAHIVISTTPGDTLEAARRLVPASHHLEVEPMTGAEGGTLLDTWLAEAGRTLRAAQRAGILEGFSTHGLPLWLRLAFEDARRWSAHAMPPPLATGIAGLVRSLYARLAADTRHGHVLVERALASIAAAREGLATNELLDVLSRDADVMRDFRTRSPDSPPVDALPDIIWSRLYFDLAPFLTERAADGADTLDFFHRQLREIVEQDWLAGVARRRRHRALAAYFDTRPDAVQSEGNVAPDRRRLTELPYQQAHGTLWRQLDRTLTSFSFLDAKTRAQGLQALLEDFELPRLMRQESRMAAGIHGVRHLLEIRESLRLAADEIATEPTQLAPQLIGRLLDSRLRRVRRLIAAADAGARGPWLRPLTASLARPGGPLLGTIVLDQDIASLACLDDFSTTVVGCADGTVRLLDVEAGREILRLAVHADAVTGVAVLNDAGTRLLVSCGRDGSVSVHDIAAGLRLGSFDVAMARVSALAVAPQGRLAFIAGRRKTAEPGVSEGIVSVRRLPDGDPCADIVSANNGVHTLSVRPNGAHVLTGASDDVLELWDAASGSLLQKEKLHDEVLAVAWAPTAGHALVAAGTPRTGRFELLLWDVDGWRELHRFRGQRRMIVAAAITPDGHTGVTGGYDRQVRVWDLTERRQAIVLRGHDAGIKAVRVRADGRRVLSAAGSTLCHWAVTVDAAGATTMGHDEAVTALAASADARVAVTAAQGGDVALRDLRRLRCLRRRTLDDAVVTAFVLSSNGSFALAGTMDGRVLRWNIRSDRVRCIAQLHDDHVTALALARNDRSAAAGCFRSSTLFEFDAADGRGLRRVDTGVEWITGIAFVDHDRRLLYAGDFALRVLDRASGRQSDRLDNGSDAPAVAVSADGRIAVSGTHYGRLHCWDLEQMTMLHDIAHTPWGQNCSVNAVAIDAAGRLALSGATDHDIRVWDLRTGACVAGFIAEDEAVCACAAGPDRWLVGSRNGAVHVLELRQ